MEIEKVIGFFKEKVKLLNDGVYKDYHNVAISALEKQVAKNPTKHEQGWLVCSRCNRSVSNVGHFCAFCGHAIRSGL